MHPRVPATVLLAVLFAACAEGAPPAAQEASEAPAATQAPAQAPMPFQLTDEPLREPAERLRTWWRAEFDGDVSRRLHDLAVGETLLLP